MLTKKKAAGVFTPEVLKKAAEELADPRVRPDKPPYKKKSKGIKCPICSSKSTVVACVPVVVEAPLARGGGIKMAGIPVNHKLVKTQWEATGTKFCRCTSCESLMTYTKDHGLVRL